MTSEVFFMTLSRLVVKKHEHAVYLYFYTNSLLVPKENVSSYLQLLCYRAESHHFQHTPGTSGCNSFLIPHDFLGPF